MRLGVLFGGKSVEHEVSIISALQAIQSINREKYEIIPIYITKNNEFYVGEYMDRIEEYKDVASLLKKSQRVALINQNNVVDLVKIPAKVFGRPIYNTIDIAFPIVHGTNVEDGTLQGMLKLLNIPFVGCDVTASAVGMDKYVMKTVLKDNGVPVLDCLCYDQFSYDNSQESVCKEIIDEIGLPVIVKPLNLGSSVGIKVAKDSEGLLEALEYAFDFSNRVLIERLVQNLKEINCSVLGDREEASASECEEPVNSDDILSYEDKYMSASSGKGKTSLDNGKSGMTSLKRKLPADITDAQRERVRDLAVKTFKLLDCNGVARIDFMMDNTTGEIWVNEINTIPGSLSFYLWEPLGKTYTQLLDDMIELSFKRYREMDNINFSFDTNILNCNQFAGSKGKS